MKALETIKKKTTRLGRSLGILLLLTLGKAAPALAQAPNRQVVNQSIEWFWLTSNIKLTKKWSALAEGQFGFAQNFQSMEHLLGIAANYDITPKLSIVPMMYSYTWNYKYGKLPASFVNDEMRISQQAVYKHKIGRVAANHRLRIEERFTQNHNATNDGELDGDKFSVYQTRLRYRFQVNIPLNKRVMEAKTLYLNISDEAFVSWGQGITYHKINQNRIIIGPGYQISKKISAQTGFYYQLLIRANGAKQENNIGIMGQLNYNIDLSKKEKTQ